MLSSECYFVNASSGQWMRRDVTMTSREAALSNSTPVSRTLYNSLTSHSVEKYEAAAEYDMPTSLSTKSAAAAAAETYTSHQLEEAPVWTSWSGLTSSIASK